MPIDALSESSEPAIPSRNFAATRRILATVLVASVVLPLVCFAGYAYFDYQHRMAVANDDLARLALVGQEHSLKVLDLNTAIAARVTDWLGGSNDDDIARQEKQIHTRLSDMSDDYPQVASMSLYGRSGKLLASSAVSPPPVESIADRDDFAAARTMRPHPYFSLPPPGRVNRESVVTTTIGRSDANGAFLGEIAIAVRRQYFIDFYQQLVGNDVGFSIGLYRRDDGASLVRVANDGLTASPSASPSASAAFVEALHENVLFGSLNTRTAGGASGVLVNFRRVGDYPVYVATTFDNALLMREWLIHLLGVAAVMALPCAAVWALVLFSFLQLRTEELAWKRWQTEVAMRVSAESANREFMRMGAMGNLVANVAHAFNNLLAVVSTNMSLAREKAFRDVESEVLAVEGATIDAQTLAQRLMSVARKQVLRPRVLNLEQWLEDERNVIETALGERASLVVQVEGCWAVRVDPRELQFAIVNVAVNARDAMPNGGRFMIRCKNVRLPGGTPPVQSGEYVLISLSDNGVGMTEAVERRAFEPFFTTRVGVAGTGLGLTQVLAMCEQAGGTARLSSAQGKGTTVRLYLPRYAGPQAPAEGDGERVGADFAAGADDAAGGAVASTAEEGEAKAPAVLLVEDDRHVAAGVTAVIELFGCRVTHDVNADDALRRLSGGERFDVVISDVQMPGVHDGLDLAEEVQRRWPGSRLALMTGYASEIGRAKGIGVPVFVKPFNLEELRGFIFGAPGKLGFAGR
ncbi:ATP-binding protein [Paraburkholderia phosphatilytica]|uniref:ATP-binding protein n=1 Tax=Paraburkholderia phosphatilytica TaxID=2282883 RepID=UPI001F0BD027|nr:ATP-binding protein [Paraburkholderia phosphatilytica]